jgi:lambda family phage minor tail protein L
MSITADIQSLTPGAVIELFEIVIGTETVRFHAGTNSLLQPVVWAGQSYAPMPIQAEGFDLATGGKMPRPKLRVANIDGVISQTLLGSDLAGSKVTRRRTMARYLDAVNFPGGVNPDADPTAEMVQDIFYIDRKTAETKAVVEFELASSMDVAGVKLPKRQIIQNSCPWRYRSGECGYAGGPVATVLDNPTSDPIMDQCGKRLDSCKLRFGEGNVLPYGGFPAAGLIRT